MRRKHIIFNMESTDINTKIIEKFKWNLNAYKTCKLNLKTNASNSVQPKGHVPRSMNRLHTLLPSQKQLPGSYIDGS